MFLFPFLIGSGSGGGGGGGGTDITPDAVTFNNFSDSAFASGNTVTITGINAPITVSLGFTGLANRQYAVNGSWKGYTASFTMNNNDTLTLGVSFHGSSYVAQSGTITVTNVTDSNATLGSCSYTVENGL